jgi:hypothetical protein
MIREILNIELFKNIVENTLNCWLSYSISQPIQFDITILMWFLIRYFGFYKILEIMMVMKRRGDDASILGIDQSMGIKMKT